MNKIKLDEHVSNAYDNNFSYEHYIRLVNKYVKKDSRELNFQNRVVIPMLEKLLINTNIEVVDTSTLYYRGNMNSNTLDNSQFTGKLNKSKYAAPPDLLLVRNWNLDNKNNKVEYLAAIEIKSPTSAEHIYGKSLENYNHDLKAEMIAHLSTNTKVILTDCYRWQFFDNKDAFVSNKKNPINEPIDLIDTNNKWKDCVEKIDKSISELSDLEIKDNPKTWDEFQSKLKSFLLLN